MMLFLVLLFELLSATALAATVSSTAAQTFLGVGGSGAWWTTDLYKFPEDVRQNLSDLLFSSSGLGLTSYRWNVGGGGVNVSNPTRAIETFYVGPGQYDWSKDAHGIYFLKAAASRGVPDLTMFANSAPAPLTAGRTSCNSHFVNGTGAQYGTFLADVAEHWINEGIPINYVSPMNEPDSNFGPSPCGQEGMQVEANQRAEVVRELYNALSSKGLHSKVGILADESNALDRATSEYGSWLPQVMDQVAAIVHHTYDFPSDSSYQSYIQKTKAAYPSKTIWMSEICCSMGRGDGSGVGWSQGYDPTIDGALVFSRLLFQSFNVAEEPHYDLWTLVSSELGCDSLSNSNCATSANNQGWNDGVIYYDDGYASNQNYKLYLTKHFWAFKHFGNFVTPGSQRRPISGSDISQSATLAVLAPDKQTYYVLAMNTNSGSNTISLTFPDNVCASTAYRTSQSEDFSEVAAAQKGSNGSWSLPLTSLSLTTYKFTIC